MEPRRFRRGKPRAVTVLAVLDLSHLLLGPFDQLFSKTNPLGAHFMNQRTDTRYYATTLAQDQQTKTANHQQTAMAGDLSCHRIIEKNRALMPFSQRYRFGFTRKKVPSGFWQFLHRRNRFNFDPFARPNRGLNVGCFDPARSLTDQLSVDRFGYQHFGENCGQDVQAMNGRKCHQPRGVSNCKIHLPSFAVSRSEVNTPFESSNEIE
jgi:hypothetical protein